MAQKKKSIRVSSINRKIVGLLCKGYNQKQIVEIMTEGGNKMRLSSLEKRIKTIKKQYGVKTLTQLGYEYARQKFSEEKKVVGICKRTGGKVLETETEGYSGYSEELDEDLYEFEIEKSEK